MHKSDKNIRFIYCSFFPVGLEDYVSFFQHYFSDCYYLKWKFPHSKDRVAQSMLIKFKEGEIHRQKKLISFSLATNHILYFLFLPLNYLIYFSQSLSFLFIPKKKFTIFMGINYFCTFCGIILKKLGRVDYVIYRVMDFFPLPPSGIYRTLNKIFYQFDKFCLKNADSIWFTTEGHIIGREKYGYFDRKDYNYEMIPLGINKNKFVSKDIDDKNKHSLVYCGVISRYHMLDLVFEAINELKKDFPDIKLNLIGSGPAIDYFKDLTKKRELNDNIIFHGYMEEDCKFTKIMSNNALGIALYEDKEDFMRYTEPAKVKYYLNYGVPILVSKVPQIAFELDKKQVAFGVSNNSKEIISKIKNFFGDKSLQIRYKDNIKDYIKEVEVNSLLSTCLANTMEKIHYDEKS